MKSGGGPVRVLARHRAVLGIGDRYVTKRHATVEAAAAEAAWYRRYAGAGITPRLLDLVGSTLYIARHATTREAPGWRPVAELRRVLDVLQAGGVHHRDVHIRNIVRGPDGPLLIDWETAIEQPAPCSYDLHGPEASGVPVPEIHAGLMPQWWGSTQAMSISRQWES